MTKKEIFINEISELIGQEPEKVLSQEALSFWNSLKTFKEVQPFTENGKKILQFMQDNEAELNNFFKAKDIGNGLSVSSRTVSGSLRKLVTDGYVEKIGTNPIIYSLTEKGEKTKPEAEEA